MGLYHRSLVLDFHFHQAVGFGARGVDPLLHGGQAVNGFHIGHGRRADLGLIGLETRGDQRPRCPVWVQAV